MKILIIILLGVIFTGIRLTRNYLSENSSKQLLKKIENNPDFANALFESLTFFYGKQKWTENRSLFEKLKTFEGKAIGKFTLHKIIEIKELGYLCITNYTDTDLDLGLNGKMQEEKKILQLNFALKIYPDKDELEFCSDIYNDLNDKNIKNRFMPELLSYLKNEKLTP